MNSRAHAVCVTVVGQDLQIQGADFLHAVPLRGIRIDEPLGTSPRTLHLDGGASLELAGDCKPLLAAIDKPAGWTFVDRLERSWPLVFLAIVAVIGMTFLLVRNVMPIAAQAAAASLPADVDKSIGEGGLLLLDKSVFKPSALDKGRQESIREQLALLIVGTQDDHTFRVEFRRGGPLGANAFALPSGIIVITDELVHLSVHPDEISAVLAHEIGHVVHRHSLRMLFQDTGTALLIGTLLGDVTSMSSLASALPTILVQSSYSREFEKEADGYAYSVLENLNIPKRRLTDILRRLGPPGDDVPESGSYFSTHPPTSERVAE
jgi:Zn-dependent protease with chaperone function